MSFTFLHAADIHLDSPLVGLSGEVAAQFRGATRRALAALVDLAIERGVAFVIIAGDLFDGDWKDYATGLFFAREAGRLHRAGIPLCLLYGNHDAESVIRRRLQLRDGVHAFSARKAETIELPEWGVALHGRSFAHRDTTENLAASYPSPVAGRLNIGVLHTALDGREGHAPYAPCTLEQLVRHGYDYWALGHVHRHEVLHEHPHVVFPGNLQGRHVRETGPKGACLVTVTDGSIGQVEHIPLDAARWAVAAVDAAGARRPDDLAARARAVLAPLVGEAEGRPLAVRLVLTGAAALPPALSGDPDYLAAELQAEAAALGEAVWIESLRLETGPPAARQTGSRPDALGRFADILDSLPDDPAFRARIQAEIAALHGRGGVGPALEAGAAAPGLQPDETDEAIRAARVLLLGALAGEPDREPDAAP
ncbi:MAG: DNA repair exonuclease [Alphaproteobacteria bacterium]|jgi:DNA repair exonuclease SbcCD nuclease subunit|nr:DNA repair exonuclease [Alphaproteobacteria bacterium]